MPRWTIIVLAVAVIIIILTAGYVGLTYLNPSEPEAGSPEAIRNQVMTTIAANYPSAEPLMADLSWSGGKQDAASLGSETYLYSSTSGWTMHLTCPVVPNPVYDVLANYTQGDISIEWMGTYEDSNVTEISCITYGLEIEWPPQMQALYDSTEYIKDNHPEIAETFRITSWSGGEVPNPEGFVGSQTYEYIGIGWNVTIQYPVVLDPIYNVNAIYASPDDTTGRIIVDWQGTWHNGTVTETHYSYNP